jgi:hypothetical protein
MHWRDIPFDPPTRTLRVFGFGCAILLAVAALWQVSEHLAVSVALGVLSPAFAIAAWARPSILRPLFVGWMMAIFPVNWVLSRLLLALIFYGMITPLGLFFRLIGRDSLGRRFQPDQESYWARKPSSDNVDSYLRPF